MNPPQTERNREMVRLRVEKRLSYRQIAARFSVSPQWARKIVIANIRDYTAAPVKPIDPVRSPPRRKPDGRLSQDVLRATLNSAIDIARGKVSSAHRDQARALVAEMIAAERWQTPYLTHHLGRARLRWLAAQGVGEAMSWLTKDKV